MVYNKSIHPVTYFCCFFRIQSKEAKGNKKAKVLYHTFRQYRFIGGVRESAYRDKPRGMIYL
jgi:hypothetical protein